MFDLLSDKLSSIFDRLRGKAFLNEDDINKVLREIRISLLEADVALPAIKVFLEKVKERALGHEILKSVSPGQMVIKLIHEELVSFLDVPDAQLNTKANSPFAYMFVGLQGSGKTTTTAKLANLLRTTHKTMLVSLDVYRAAAQKQLQILSDQIGVRCLDPVQGEPPLSICQRAFQEARQNGMDIILFDTAGRTHIDEAMMNELSCLHREIHPLETLLVVDSMTGQDAIHMANSFKQTVPLTGLIFTRVDGDARGGAILSVRQITDCPVKFLGTGEHIDQLIPFDAHRIADQILDRGDVVAFVQKAEKLLTQKEVEKAQDRLEKGIFTLDDMLTQLDQMGKMGKVSDLVKMIPGIKSLLKGLSSEAQEKIQSEQGDLALKRQKALILSMTPLERRKPEILNASRRRRIAEGAGQTVANLNQLLKQYKMIKDMTKKYAKGGLKKFANLFGKQMFRKF